MGNKEETVDDTTEQQRCSSTDGMLELDSLRLDGASKQLREPNSSHHDSDNDDDDDSDNDNNNIDGISASYHVSEPQHTTRHTTYFLGTKFNKSRDQRAMANYSKQLYWLTYRNDLVVPLSPYSATNAQSLVGNITHGGGLSGVTGDGGMKTDAGWGCMLRSAQMLLAQTVRRHHTLIEEKKSSRGITSSDGVKKRGSIIHNRRGGEISQTRSLSSSSSIEHHKLNWKQLVDPIEVERIANWFADFPNHPDYNLLLDDSTLSDEMKGDSQEDQSSSNKEQEEEEYGNGGLAFHWYSLHQMVAAGLGLGVLPGEWYGPTTACHVLRELNEVHVDRRERLADKLNVERGVEEETDAGLKCDMFRIHVATEGCIYLDAIAKLMNQSGGSDTVADNIETNADDPLSLSEIDDPLRPPTQQQQEGDAIDNEDDIQWDTSLLLLLPLRLGIQSISTSNYGSTLSKLISFPQSVGMLGGTPRHALFFYGADAVNPPSLSEDNTGEQDDVGGWYGLDPHTVQMAPRGTQILCNNGSTNTTTTKAAPRYRWQVQLTDSYLRSLHFSSTTSHANHERSIPLSSLDPSCALGFYIHDYSDFVNFQRLLKELSTEHCKPNKLPEIITVLDKTPNYEVDVSAAINDMIRTEGNGVVKVNDDIDGFSMQSDDGGIDPDDDDDDFVLI